LLRRIKLAVARRIRLLATVVSLILLVVVCRRLLRSQSQSVSSASRYAVFGLDSHPSVMRLLATDVTITRLVVDDEERYDERANTTAAAAADTIGVFVVVNSSTSFQTESWSDAGDSLRCVPSYRYRVFVVSSSESSDGVDDVARQLRRACVQTAGATTATPVVVWLVRVRGDVAASVVADLVTEAYVDNVTWYDVVFLPRITSFPTWRRWPPAQLGAPPSHVGAAVMRDPVAAAVARVAFHRTHLDIFGDCWPAPTRSGADVARYLTDVYANDARDSPVHDTTTTVDSALRDDRTWLQRHVSIHTSSVAYFGRVK